MTHSILLPFEDHDGTLSALVDDAIAHGATADRDHSNVATNTFVLTFTSKKAKEAFEAKLGGAPASDPVDDSSETPAAE